MQCSFAFLIYGYQWIARCLYTFFIPFSVATCMWAQLSIFSVLMLELRNCAAKMGTFYAEENVTSYGIVGRDKYCRFCWNFQTHMIWFFGAVSLNWMSQTTKCFMSKGKSTALTTYLPLLWQNLFNSAPKWLPHRCWKMKTDCIRRPLSFNCWFFPLSSVLKFFD